MIRRYSSGNLPCNNNTKKKKRERQKIGKKRKKIRGLNIYLMEGPERENK